MLVGILALAEGSASSSSTGPERLHSSTWETRYILLLWLSVCVRLPFSFSLLAPGTETKLAHMGVGWIGRSGKESDAAAEVLGQLYSRNDVDLTGLLDRCESALTLDDSNPSIVRLTCHDLKCGTDALRSGHRIAVGARPRPLDILRQPLAGLLPAAILASRLSSGPRRRTSWRVLRQMAYKGRRPDRPTPATAQGRRRIRARGSRGDRRRALTRAVSSGERRPETNLPTRN